MKYFFLLLLIASFATTKAQNNPVADSNVTLKGLPVLRSYVAPDVVERAKKKFGRALYSIEKTVAADCENSYLVGLLNNRKLSMQWMCDDPKMVRREREGVEIVAKN